MADGYIWLGTTDASDTFLSDTTYPSTTAQGDVIYASAANTISSLAKDTNATRYLANTGASNNPAWSQVALGTGVSGQLPLANGGTAANLTASNGGIFYSTASAGAILSGTATANQVLLSGSSTTPAWSTATYPATTTANQILYSSATNVVGGITAAANGILCTDTSSVPSITNTVRGDFTFTSTGSTTIRTLIVSNTDNTAVTSGALIKASSGGASAGDATYQASTTTTTWSFGVDNSVTSPTVDPFVIAQGTALGTNNALSIDTSLRAQWPSQPMFLANLSLALTDVTGDGTTYTVLFDTDVYNRGTVYNTGTGTFTAPVDGVYLLTASLAIKDLTAAMNSGIFTIFTTARPRVMYTENIGAIREQNSGNNVAVVSGSCFDYMTAGQTAVVKITITGGTKVADITATATNNGTYFGAYLLG